MTPKKPTPPPETPPAAVPGPSAEPVSGPTFPGRLIASLLDLTERRLQQLVASGWIPRAERGAYGLRESVRGYIRYLKEHGREQQRGHEQARLARAQAVRVEMENFKRMGELLPRAQVEEITQGLIVMMKSSHEALPGRLASELAAIADPPIVYQRLQTELRDVCDLCADFLDKRANALEAMPEPRTHDATVAPADADELGATESSDAAG